MTRKCSVRTLTLSRCGRRALGWVLGAGIVVGSWLRCLEECGECRARVGIWAGGAELGFEGESLELLEQAVKQRMMKVLRLPALRH